MDARTVQVSNSETLAALPVHQECLWPVGHQTSHAKQSEQNVPFLSIHDVYFRVVAIFFCASSVPSFSPFYYFEFIINYSIMYTTYIGHLFSTKPAFQICLSFLLIVI